jgi:hypothetical protein
MKKKPEVENLVILVKDVKEKKNVDVDCIMR